MHFVFKELYKQGFNPDLIRKGNKMYQMRVNRVEGENPTVTFRDSYNMMTCSLSALVPMFNLDVKDKPFFPHLLNRPENYGRRDVQPKKSDYMADTMMPEKRKEFDEWYNQNETRPFFLDEALASYCMNDVDILMAALIAFRTEFMDVSKRQRCENDTVDRAASKKPHDGVDVLREAMTIACKFDYFRT